MNPGKTASTARTANGFLLFHLEGSAAAWVKRGPGADADRKEANGVKSLLPGPDLQPLSSTTCTGTALSGSSWQSRNVFCRVPALDNRAEQERQVWS